MSDEIGGRPGPRGAAWLRAGALGAAALGVVALGGAAAWAGGRRPAAAAGPGGAAPVPVRVAEVTEAAGERGESYSGAVRARTQVELAFKVGGYVERLGGAGPRRPLQEGDRVRRGQVLAALRPGDYEARVAEGAARRAQAAAAARQAALDFERAGRLHAAQVVPQAELDGARNRLAGAEGAERAAAAGLSGASLQLVDTRLVAPFDGVVLRRWVEEGALVGPGAPGFTVADLDEVKVVFTVPDRTAVGLRPGQAVEVSTQAHPGRRWRGEISRLPLAADPRSRAFEVEARVGNADHALRVDMSATASPLAPGAGADGAAGAVGAAGAWVEVPLGAVVKPSGAPSFVVWRLAAGAGEAASCEAVEVKADLLRGDRARVQGALRAGDRVVVRGAAQLVSGAPVRVLP
jgi:RND family efflux transporter MFP subunit